MTNNIVPLQSKEDGKSHSINGSECKDGEDSDFEDDVSEEGCNKATTVVST